MFGRVGKALRGIGHGAWVQMQESGAIMAGTRIQLDPRVTGDKFSPSPAVEEVFRADYQVTETREIHETRRT